MDIDHIDPIWEAFDFDTTHSAVDHLKIAGKDLLVAGRMAAISVGSAAFGPLGAVQAGMGAGATIISATAAVVETGRAVGAVAMGNILTVPPGTEENSRANEDEIKGITQWFTEAMGTPLSGEDKKLAENWANNGITPDSNKAIPAIALGKYINAIDRARTTVMSHHPIDAPDLTYNQILADTKTNFTPEDAAHTYISILKGRNQTDFSTDEIRSRDNEEFESRFKISKRFNQGAFNQNLKVAEVAYMSEADFKKFHDTLLNNMRPNLLNLNAYVQEMLPSKDANQQSVNTPKPLAGPKK